MLKPTHFVFCFLFSIAIFIGNLNSQDSLKYQKLANEYNRVLAKKSDFYQFNPSDKKQAIKGIAFTTDNDFLAINSIIKKYRTDWEYTGAMRLSVITDYARLKLFSFRPDFKYASYQTVYFGFENYTPDILDVEEFESLDTLQRPFAAFTFIGKSSNLLSKNGNRRIQSNLRIGILGGTLGRYTQMIIHNDIVPGSQINRGWDFQIGNGGRLMIQYDLEYEYRINQNFYYGWVAGAGHEKIYGGASFTVSNLNFFQRNPTNGIFVSNVNSFSNKAVFCQIKETFFLRNKN